MSKPKLWINTTADSWVTEKFPGAIRIARDHPPFAFGEDVAAVYPTLGVEFAQEIITAYNEHDALCKVAEAARNMFAELSIELDQWRHAKATLEAIAGIRKRT